MLRSFAQDYTATSKMKIPVEVVGVRVEMPSNQPIILLREIGGIRYLPIWVGAVEATAIAFAQQGVTPPRPLTHDLMLDLMKSFEATLQKVAITEMVDGIFIAELEFFGGKSISARPSDALTLAIKSEVPILVDEDLFAQAGIEIPESDRPTGYLMDSDGSIEAISEHEEGGAASSAPLSEGEVERFREFLDQINPDDFLN